MATWLGASAITRGKFQANLFVAAVVAVWLFPATFMTVAAGDAAGSLSDGDKKCLSCHAYDGLEKKLANGDALSLHIQGDAFAQSVHQPIGCAACHGDVDPKKHPGAAKKINSSREYSVARTEICGQCHQDKLKLYEGSIHATLVRDGNPVAPVCTDCHSPHSIRAKAARKSIDEVPCRKCHATIFDAYAASVHGRARSKAGDSPAPICADCHHAHDVGAASAGDQVKNACLACHPGTLAAHEKWLPNTERHLETVSCPACHAPTAQRKVDLRLYDTVAHERVAEREGVPQFEAQARSADTKGIGLDAMALRSLLRDFNRNGGEGKTTLRGRLEVRTGAEAHQLADKTKAIRNCDSCHRAGADPFQSVTVSIVGADGRPVRYGAQKEVLSSVISVDSMGGFYAIGGTRIRLLDVLLALVVLGVISASVGHFALRKFFRKYLKRSADKNAAENRPAQGRD